MAVSNETIKEVLEAIKDHMECIHDVLEDRGIDGQKYRDVERLEDAYLKLRDEYHETTGDFR